MSNIHLWTPTHEHDSVDCRARPYIHKLCVDYGCSTQKKWMIRMDGKRENFVSSAQPDDEDEEDIYI